MSGPGIEVIFGGTGSVTPPSEPPHQDPEPGPEPTPQKDEE